MKLLCFVVTVGLSAAAASAQFAHHSDLRLRVAGGKIVTDAVEHDTGQVTANISVFGWDFGEQPGNPYSLEDPGFQVASNSGFAAGSVIGFYPTRSLSFWNGEGAVNLSAAPPDGESLLISFAASSVAITGGSGLQGGFDVLGVGGGGTHRHLNTELLPGTTTEPAAGVYLTAVRVRNSGGVADSDAIYWLFGNGVNEEQIDAALEYVASPHAGDANFSGRTDIADFATLATNFNAPGEKFWYDGDFNGDRTVSIGDFSLLAANFNTSAASRGAPVPEPSFAFFAAALGLLNRKLQIANRKCMIR